MDIEKEEVKEEEDLSHVTEKTLQKMALSAQYYANVCPAIARYYNKEIQFVRQKLTHSRTTAKSSLNWCRFCGQLFQPDNMRVKAAGTLRMCKSLKRIQEKARRRGEKTLSKLQKKLFDMYANGGTRVEITCKCCKKTTVQQCSDKQYRLLKRQKKEQEVNVKPLSRGQKKRQKRKLADKHAGLVMPNAPTPPPGPSAKARPVQAALKQTLAAQARSAEAARATKKKKLTALARMVAKDSAERESKQTSGSGLASFLSSLNT